MRSYKMKNWDIYEMIHSFPWIMMLSPVGWLADDLHAWCNHWLKPLANILKSDQTIATHIVLLFRTCSYSIDSQERRYKLQPTFRFVTIVWGLSWINKFWHFANSYCDVLFAKYRQNILAAQQLAASILPHMTKLVITRGWSGLIRGAITIGSVKIDYQHQKYSYMHIC